MGSGETEAKGSVSNGGDNNVRVRVRGVLAGQRARIRARGQETFLATGGVIQGGAGVCRMPPDLGVTTTDEDAGND